MLFKFQTKMSQDFNMLPLVRASAQESVQPETQPAQVVDHAVDVNLSDAPAVVSQEPLTERKSPPMIVLVLDASGSMQHIANDIRGSVNTFIEEQKQLPEDGTCLSFVVFADEATERFFKKPIADVPVVTEADYKCSGNTALYDAIALAIDHHNEEPEALVVVVTDGEENHSRTSHDELHRKIEAKKAAGWKFIYLANEPRVSQGGANVGLCAAAVGAAYTASNNIAVGYDAMAPTLARAVSSAVGVYRTTTQVPNLNEFDVGSGVNPNLQRSQTMPVQGSASHVQNQSSQLGYAAIPPFGLQRTQSTHGLPDPEDSD